MEKREKFSSRLGFILISAGCAIGLGNVWRFPYITGKYGGAAFVLMYLVFLIALGLPIVVMEFAVGRASQKSVATSFRVLEKKGQKWHLFGYVGVAGNYLLMMFYTTISGWMLAYLFGMVKGDFVGLNPTQVGGYFDALLASPVRIIFWLVLAILIGFGICGMGLQNGVEKVSKFMMGSLFIVMIALVFRSVTLEGATEGLKFYLMPDFGKMTQDGRLGESIFAAMGQAFFTLSIGIGSMAIFGSYINKERRLTGEAISVTLLDTTIAIIAGLIIFPACFAFGVDPGAGPGLVFVTLPNIFNNMPLSQLWGSLFFVFMSFAALTTVVAVFENIVSFGMDLWGWTRKKSVVVNIFLVTLLALPCALGFNLLSSIQPLGPGTGILDLEDFIVSNNLLPLGSLFYLFFCMSRYGWGWDNFTAEANTGKGLKFPKAIRFYLTWILPAIVIVIFVQGYWEKIFKVFFVN